MERRDSRQINFSNYCSDIDIYRHSSVAVLSCSRVFVFSSFKFPTEGLFQCSSDIPMIFDLA